MVRRTVINIDTDADLITHTRRWPDVVLMLDTRHGRRPNIKTTLGKC